jgi:hypothetical protein
MRKTNFLLLQVSVQTRAVVTEFGDVPLYLSRVGPRQLQLRLQ